MDEQTKALGAAGGAVGLGGSALLLGLCCQPTWAGALLGSGAAMTLGRYGFLQPYLLGAAALLIVGLFWMAYHRRPSTLSPERAQVERFRLRALAWATALVLAAFVTVTVLAPMGQGR
jgi:hypothetical protein